MDWETGYIIDRDGCCHWQEAMVVRDPGIVEAYLHYPLLRLRIECFVELGVKVGAA
jgi:hypothetical protein